MDRFSVTHPHEFIEGVLDAERERQWLPWAIVALWAIRRGRK